MVRTYLAGAWKSEFWTVKGYSRMGELEDLEAWLKANLESWPDVLRVEDNTYESILNVAAACGTLASIRLLHAYGACDDAEIARDALFWAVRHERRDAVLLLLELGVDVNSAASNGWTALMEAAAPSSTRGGAHLGLLRLLLSRGADYNLTYYNDGEDWYELGADPELFGWSGHVDAEGQARRILRSLLSTYADTPNMPDRPREQADRLESAVTLLADVRAAGGWKAYVNAPRRSLLVLRALCERGCATPPPLLAPLFPGPAAGLAHSLSGQDPVAAQSQRPSSDSSDDDDDEEVRRLEAALAAAKAKKKRRSRASTPPRPELPKELFRIVVSFWRSELDGVVSDFGGNGYKVVNGTLVYDAG